VTVCAGSALGAAEEPLATDPENMERINEAAISFGEAVFDCAARVLPEGVAFAEETNAGSDSGEPNNTLMRLAKPGLVCGATIDDAATRCGSAASIPIWFADVAASAFTHRTKAGHCPKRRYFEIQ